MLRKPLVLQHVQKQCYWNHWFYNISKSMLLKPMVSKHFPKFAWPSVIGVADTVPLYTARCFINHRERARGAPSAPDPKSHHLGDDSWRTFLPLALQGSIFSIFWSIGEASNNDDFLASQQNVKNQMIDRTWEARVTILDPKTWFVRSPLVYFVYRFFEWPKIKNSDCFSILFNGVGPSKTIDDPIVFPLFFMFFQNRSPRQFLEGPSAELLWTCVCWCHFSF